jgi:Cu(I)/Ag(I) efflux system periplasmic protein CusF
MKPRISLLLALVSFVCSVAFAAGPIEGEVRKIDAAQGKLTLKHPEIKALDIPAMTRSYRVQDAAVLKQLSVGNQVRFSVEKIDGSYTITQVQKLP